MKKVLSIEEQKNCYDAFNSLMPNEVVKVAIVVEDIGVDKAFDIFSNRMKVVIPKLQTNMFYNAMLYISSKMKGVSV